MSEVYILFSKLPKAGYVKTRLSPAYSAADAAAIQAKLLQMIAARASKLPHAITLWCCYEAFGDEALVSRWKKRLPARFQWVPQIAGSLGQRMNAAFEEAQASGFQKIILSGSDLVGLTPEYLHRAFAALNKKTAVIAPTLDGGYGLIGFAGPIDTGTIFLSDISWSTASVFQTTLMLLQKMAASTQILPQLIDIDLPKDVLQLQREP
ncbi:MAG: TIGR04282 family arsenosugar biosynthesis glycosyltransferase [Enterococcaceae bacterium]|jgi:rSAM/selenodomain-associated transferase 1|nr:TIGR04282 family arsenosugar biosynthesis glycosyltransferase [Enterococcaceae bacterium]MCI1919350.1 TIGR04282 family arsenosugar biosynthesis glycosyltransferase [Enterococcaceae bacterium]